LRSCSLARFVVSSSCFFTSSRCRFALGPLSPSPACFRFLLLAFESPSPISERSS
jgi:hypothetical protein